MSTEPFVPLVVGAAASAAVAVAAPVVPLVLPTLGDAADPGGGADVPGAATAGDAARAAGWAAGYAAGARRAAEVAAEQARLAEAERAEAEARRRAEHAAALEALARAARAAAERELPLLSEAERTLHAAAVELAEAILGVELSDATGSARAALARVLEHPWTPDDVTVRLHPRDLAAAEAERARGTLDVPDGVRLEADPHLQPGDAVARHPEGYLDARVGTALERARAALAGTAGEGAP